MKAVLRCLIVAYQKVLSPLLGPRCRFYPTCSHYALQAIERHGPFQGMILSLRRISRCHPLSAGGYDPVPDTRSVTNHHQEREC